MSETRKILVVDDEAIIVSFLQSLLSASRPLYQIETANSGEEAIQKVKTFKPHLVVLDLNIPGGSGFDVCASILKDGVQPSTVVLAMTSDSNPERVRRIQELGARECLIKPFPLADFLKKVERYTVEAAAAEKQADASP